MAYKYPQTLVLLANTPASSSSTIDFTSLITANFTSYYVKLRNIVPATDNVQLQLLFSTNNGSSYLGSAYGWTNTKADSNGTLSATGNASTAAIIQVASNLSSTTANALNGDLEFFNLNSGVLEPRCMGQLEYIDNAAHSVMIETAGLNTGVTAVTAIRFQMSSGNIASGNFLFYGVKET